MLQPSTGTRTGSAFDPALGVPGLWKDEEPAVSRIGLRAERLEKLERAWQRAEEERQAHFARQAKAKQPPTKDPPASKPKASDPPKPSVQQGGASSSSGQAAPAAPQQQPRHLRNHPGPLYSEEGNGYLPPPR